MKDSGVWAGFCPVCKRPFEACLVDRPLPQVPSVVGRFAYVIVLWGTNADYILGALVLGKSLRQEGARHDLIVMYTSDVLPPAIELLRRVGWQPREVEAVQGVDRLYNHGEPRFEGVFTKLRVMGLTEYEKVLLLDIDTLVLKNMDHLFELPAPAAMVRGPRSGYKHGQQIEGRYFFAGGGGAWGQSSGINAGVMLLAPDQIQMEQMLSEVLDQHHPSHVRGNGPEQDYLSRFYADSWSHISVEYNFQLHQMYFVLHPDFINTADRTQFLQAPPGAGIHLVHYSGSLKPWAQVLDVDWVSRTDSDFLQAVLETFNGWWLWVERDPEMWKSHAKRENITLGPESRLYRIDWDKVQSLYSNRHAWWGSVSSRWGASASNDGGSAWVSRRWEAPQHIWEECKLENSISEGDDPHLREGDTLSVEAARAEVPAWHGGENTFDSGVGPTDDAGDASISRAESEEQWTTRPWNEAGVSDELDDKALCWRFNNGSECDAVICQYVHACNVHGCRGDHSALHCPKACDVNVVDDGWPLGEELKVPDSAVSAAHTIVVNSLSKWRETYIATSIELGLPGLALSEAVQKACIKTSPLSAPSLAEVPTGMVASDLASGEVPVSTSAASSDPSSKPASNVSQQNGLGWSENSSTPSCMTAVAGVCPSPFVMLIFRCKALIDIRGSRAVGVHAVAIADADGDLQELAHHDDSSDTSPPNVDRLAAGGPGEAVASWAARVPERALVLVAVVGLSSSAVAETLATLEGAGLGVKGQLPSADCSVVVAVGVAAGRGGDAWQHQTMTSVDVAFASADDRASMSNAAKSNGTLVTSTVGRDWTASSCWSSSKGWS